MFRKLFLIPILVAALSFSSYAASMTVTTTTVQAEAGLITIVTGNFTISFSPTGFSNYFPIGASLPASTSCTWPSVTCQSALTAGHWAFTVLATLNTSPSAASSFTMYVFTNGVNPPFFGNPASLSFTVPAGTAAGTNSFFTFDTGSGTLTAPIVTRVIIQ